MMTKIRVAVLNKQQDIDIDRDWISKISNLIFMETINNLTKNPSPRLTRDWLNTLKVRADLSLVLVSNQQIRAINRKWRQKDKSTDVLSFTLTTEPPPPHVSWELGEVIISVGKARQQAKELGHSLERELAFLFTHGLLHLLGFDHHYKKEEQEMILRQKEILTSAGFPR